MKDLRGTHAILTGANGGLGVHLARCLAREGVHLLLVAFPGVGLEEVESVSRQLGVRATLLVADLRTGAGRQATVQRAMELFGSVELLVNNAGVEYNSLYHELDPERIQDVLGVNLEAPMMLTRQLVPGMLAQGCGHIVSISSLAGKSGPAYQEPYAATKAAISAFTFSLRSSYRGTGVSASAITPGFVEAGIYTRLKQQSGRSAPALLGACPPETVCRAMIRAIRQDLPEIIINRYPIRPALAVSILFPRVGEWLVRCIGVHDFFGRVAAAQHPASADPGEEKREKNQGIAKNA